MLAADDIDIATMAAAVPVIVGCFVVVSSGNVRKCTRINGNTKKFFGTEGNAMKM